MFNDDVQGTGAITVAAVLAGMRIAATRPRERSLMLVTALSPRVGYDKASAIAHKADDEGTTLRQAALALWVSPTDFDRIVVPKAMIGAPRRDLGLTN
jgi:fumarate hydratase class II